MGRFFLYFHECETQKKIFFKKSLLTGEVNSIFNVKIIAFSVYNIFFGFWTFFQILDTACNTWFDVKIGRVYKPVNSNDRKFRELIHTQIAYVTLNFSFVSEGKKVDSMVFSEDEVNNFNKVIEVWVTVCDMVSL